MPCLPLGSVAISALDESPSLYLIKSSFPTYLKYIQQPHVKVASLSFHLFFHEPFHFSSFVIVTTVCSIVTLLQICQSFHPAPNTPIFRQICQFVLQSLYFQPENFHCSEWGGFSEFTSLKESTTHINTDLWWTRLSVIYSNKYQHMVSYSMEYLSCCVWQKKV